MTSDIRELVQDLRANAHRCPEELRPIIRRAAAALEQTSGLVPIADFMPRPVPIEPPGRDPRAIRQVKGAPCS